MIRNLQRNALSYIILTCYFAAMLFINFFSWNFYSICLMLIAAIVSLVKFMITDMSKWKGGVKIIYFELIFGFCVSIVFPLAVHTGRFPWSDHGKSRHLYWKQPGRFFGAMLAALAVISPAFIIILLIIAALLSLTLFP